MTTQLLETKPLISGAEFFEIPDPEASELVAGEIVPMSRTSSDHGYFEAMLGIKLGNFVLENNLGWIYVGETGIFTKYNPDTVRAADIIFISRQRSATRPSGGFLTLAPDLIAEVISPNDRWRVVQTKVREYFAIGTGEVWLVDPEIKTIWRYQSPSEVEVYEADTVLVGKNILEGFTLTLSELFSELPAS